MDESERTDDEVYGIPNLEFVHKELTELRRVSDELTKNIGTKAMGKAEAKRHRKAIYDHFTPVVLWVRDTRTGNMTESTLKTWARKSIEESGLDIETVRPSYEPEVEEIKTEFDN